MKDQTILAFYILGHKQYLNVKEFPTTRSIVQLDWSTRTSQAMSATTFPCTRAFRRLKQIWEIKHKHHTDEMELAGQQNSKQQIKL
jgi:hypothetical protein